MKDVKIVFIDMDGTLRDNSGKISDETMKSISKLNKLEIQIVLTTGRALRYKVNVAKLYDGGDYLITSNGAEIYNYKSNNLIYSSPISKKERDYISEKVLIYRLFFIANTKDFRYTNRLDDNTGMKKVDLLSEVDADINQVVVQSHDVKSMRLFERDILDNENLKISNKTTKLVDGKYIFFDVTNSNVSKGNAVKKLCEYLSIPLDKTMAIGNSVNDIEMFKVCKYKIAVANADDEIKNIATELTLSNDEEGVKAILDKLYNELKR